MQVKSTGEMMRTKNTGGEGRLGRMQGGTKD
jgi:hypothetical protein